MSVIDQAVRHARVCKRDGMHRDSVKDAGMAYPNEVQMLIPRAVAFVYDGVPLEEPKPVQLEIPMGFIDKNGNIHSTAPDPLPDVPASMKEKRQWVRWKLETRHGKLTKVPYQVSGKPAASDDPSTWTDYITAVTGATINSTQGVGLMFSDGIAGIDLDGCRNPKTAEIAPWADDIVNALDNVYVEVSPSGTGLHIFVLGSNPGKDAKFNLNPAIGFGDKVGIEIYDNRRYFTVTGDSFFEEPGDVVQCDLTTIYQKFHELRAAHPAPRNSKAESADAAMSESIQPTWHGALHCSKYDIFKRGEVVSERPFVIDNRIGSLEYASQSEADLAFCNILALMHDGDENKVWEEYVNSTMAREKWLEREEDFRRLTVAKAIESAKKIAEKKKQTFELTPQAPVEPAPAALAVATPATLCAVPATPVIGESLIPAFDDSVITGFFREIVDFVTTETTIPRQFPFLAAKVYIGARMAGRMSFEGMQDDPTMYGTPIGETGTSKGLSWERTIFQTLLPQALLERPVKVIYSFDSGAGLRDAFFDPPKEQPVIGYIDEVRSLGHKAGEKKNPEIIDTIIELANGHRISRSKAKRSKSDKVKTHESAYLGLYMCGQKGEAFMSSFPGRTSMGLWDRFYPEYTDPIEPGDLPLLEPDAALALVVRLNKMPFSGRMTMGAGLKEAVNKFWQEQPKEVRLKVRFKSHLMLDMYFAAWSHGRMVAELADLNVAIRIFQRQVIIRRVHFAEEVPDRVGHYIGLLKTITANMRKRLNAGEPMAVVALSIRDFQTQTNAFRENEIHVFNQAWRNFQNDYLASLEVLAKNGHKYTKYVPIPFEHEMWASTPEVQAKVAAEEIEKTAKAGAAWSHV